MVKEIGMVAGGTGITPMLQIIKAILRNPADKTKISLIFGNVTKSDILLEEELQGLAEQHPDRFSVYHVLNEPPENWNQGVGFITKDILEQRLPKPSNDVKILVCGPPPMVKAVTNATTDLGYEPPRTVSKLTDQVFKF
ncbi:NADH-cytochrome b5 reductase [Rhizopus azygosporus]|nr:NADH-cytochrome b5 reductase [Rhizopus azygosporus]